MPSENEELRTLLSNIRKGLKLYTVSELNDAIESELSKKDGKQEEIEVALDLVCAEFKISRRTLLRGTGRGYVQDAKRTAYCLLSINLGLPFRYTAKKVFSISHGRVQDAVKLCRNLSDNVKPDREFKERYERLSKALIEKTKK